MTCVEDQLGAHDDHDEHDDDHDHGPKLGAERVMPEHAWHLTSCQPDGIYSDSIHEGL